MDKDIKINVIQYLPIIDKGDLIDITIQNSIIDGYVDVVALEVNLKLNIVKMYSTFHFDVTPENDIYTIYDSLTQNKIIERVINAIPSREYRFLMDLFDKAVEAETAKLSSLGYTLKKYFGDMSKSAEEAAKIIDSFDKEKYTDVLNLAKAAGYRGQN